ncbi:probable lysine-specific demethylase JMJ703 at N-terminal half [Coccomyxa sp. Obi]|nr:probable lysine-specific demethylase JMJ703 at N-terminal half [Coccomyxa sp. Obi]
MMLPVEESAADVGGNLTAEKGLTTSSVVLPETSLPDKHAVHEVLEEPLNGTAAPQDASTEQEAAKGAQELESAQPGDNILGPEVGEGHLCANGGRQRRASALAATRKVSDYIVQESKSIRELRNDLQAEVGQSTKRQGKKRKASPTTPLSMPVKTSPSSSAAEACTQQLWEGSSDGEAGPVPVPAAAELALTAPAQEEAAAAPLQTSVAELPTANGCAEHHAGAPAEAPELPAAAAADTVEPDGEAPSTVHDAIAAPPVEVDAAPVNVEIATVAEDASPASDDVQPAAAETQAVLDGLIQAAEGDATVDVDGSAPPVEAADEEEADEIDEGAEEMSEEETAEGDKEWPPQGSSLAAEAALLPGRTQYVRKSALEARTKIAAPRMKRKYTRRVADGGEPNHEGNTGEPAPEGGQQGAEVATPPVAPGEKASFFPSGKRRGRPPGSRNLRPRGRGRGRGRGRWGSARRSRTQDTPSDDDDAAELADDAQLPAMSPTASYYKDQEMEMDTLHGCTKCRFNASGCGACRDAPILERPKSVRWKPDAARPQTSVPLAPTFYPTPEEFEDPVAYINKIRPEGEKAGIACIVPPEGWDPPFALEKGTNGQSAESFRFSIRKQLTSHLCMRSVNTGKATKRAPSRYDRGGDEEDHAHEHTEFGFVTLERPYTLKSFAAYADWVKALHFSDPPPKNFSEPVPSKKRKLCNYSGPEPTVEEIEAEFWRIVESPDEVVESLYGQDLDSGHHGSGFPLPPFRQRLLEAHLAATEGKKEGEGRKFTPEEAAYSEHKWNINNMPRCKGSVLRYLVGEELITGVMVPWLYVGSCLSAFCWHVEDHALYSVNYLHMGAPKVWYGVPAHASEALEIAMRDALPHLFEHSPDLLYQLVTLVSPTQLRARGVPVHRLVHKEGSFVITFPNAYHAGFNTGFNCAEAVNFGPPDWLPWGTYVADKYRREGRSATLSHDALLIALVGAAPDVSERLKREAEAAEAERVKVKLTADEDAGTVSVELCVPSQPADVKMEDGDVKMEEASEPAEEPSDRASSQQTATTSGRDYVPGESTDLSFLDPINRADTPPRAIQLAAAELSLRIEQNRLRLNTGLGDAVNTITRRRMCGKVGAMDADGVHTNTEDVDCEVCKGDLHLWAVVSVKCPGRATCAEHASALGCPVEDIVLLYRFTLEELETFLEDAKRLIPGAAEAIDHALEHKAHQKHEPGVIKLGPISMGQRLRIGGDVDSDEEAEDATPSPLPAAQPQLVKRQYKRKTVDASEGPPKPKRKYTRRSNKWKTKKTKPLNSDDEDEQMPDVDGGEAEAGLEASAGDGLRRTRRPRAATRNISELLADAEDSFGEEELEVEPEPDSEQEGRRGGGKRRGLPTKRGGRRRSSAAEGGSQEPLPIIEHELAAQPLPYEVPTMSVPSVPVPVWPPKVPPPVVSPVAPSPPITTGVPQLPPSAAPVAPVPQMIPIAMLAELQRLMAHNAAVAASGNKPPGSISFNPYELLAHAANEHQNGGQGMLPLMQTLARLLPLAAIQNSQPPPSQSAPAPAALPFVAQPAHQPGSAQLDHQAAFPTSAASASFPQFSAPYPGLPNLPTAGWPPGFTGSTPMFQQPATAPQQPAWPPVALMPQPTYAAQSQPLPPGAQPPQVAHAAPAGPAVPVPGLAQPAVLPEQPPAGGAQPASELPQSGSPEELQQQAAPSIQPMTALEEAVSRAEAQALDTDWPAGAFAQAAAPVRQLEPLAAAEFTAMINQAHSHAG